MNLHIVLSALKRYGLKGVFDFVRRRKADRALARLLADKTLDLAPTPGITVIACLDAPFSLSKTMRDFAKMLQTAGIPHQVLNLPSEKPVPESEYRHLITPLESFVTNKYTHIITLCQTFDIPDKRCSVHAIEFWEFEDGFKESHPEVLWINNIVAMSDFNFNTFKKLLPSSNVNKILYPFQFTHGSLTPTGATRRKYNIPEDAFTVFFNFDFRSSYYRKNPEGILRAFRHAFAPSDKAVVVFKTMRAKACQVMSERLHTLVKELHLEKQLLIIDDFMPQEDLVNLTNACDVYMSLHRGEGFGLGIAEAMTLGKPVIVTDYSSTTEFCKPDNAMLVPYTIVPVTAERIDVDNYRHVSRWAEPDIAVAAKALRQLFDHPEQRHKLGSAAQMFIGNYFSVENFKRSIEAFLRQHV